MNIYDIDRLTFGPVPSRRLGRSLGINNIVPKICSYGCLYCQLGNTLKMQIDHELFYPLEDIVASVKKRVEKAKRVHASIDYLTFVPDGEPTLDLNLGKEIEALKSFGIKIAVISNASLIDREDVQSDLMKADWVSLKVDTVHEQTWHRLDRPNGKLSFQAIQDGMMAFKKRFQGFLATETMLVKGVNDTKEELEATAAWLKQLQPDRSYISVPTRPPAESDVEIPEDEIITMAWHIFQENGIDTELLIDYEGDDFTFTEDPRGDLLSITSVHPMRKEAVERFLAQSNGRWEDVELLLREHKLKEIRYHDHIYYARVLTKPKHYK